MLFTTTIIHSLHLNNSINNNNNTIIITGTNRRQCKIIAVSLRIR